MLYTKSDVATMMKISIDTVERIVKRGDLAPTKIGTCVRFSQTSIDNCVKRLTVSKSLPFSPDPKEVISAELARMGRQI